ncbi:SAM-dependent methyltransferase [Geosmithia morbida]|uniref:SAM-dependent methyltransferase n=1 Tax=Geosmithia morbida TaxID=1094350 RepID=A0A9P4YS67_9HYPO|nr:SAM-dependent methyltransferase [Geosmithia morbida]KAF4120748.1 SAM-dependent methyltransferase [Geosmithia morbida]
MAHHHHHHHHVTISQLGEENAKHFDHVGIDMYSEPWVRVVTDQIFEEIRSEAGWIGVGKEESKLSSSVKVFDYACGNGVVSRSLGPFVSITRGMDVSSSMVEQYNIKAREDGYTEAQMHAVRGDLVADAQAFPDMTGFDLIVMSTALHHVEDPQGMIRTLADRMAPGGALIIIDGVAPSEGGGARVGDHPARKVVTRQGFERHELEGWFGNAGLEEVEWKLFSKSTQVPETMGGLSRMFFARGVKASN